MRKHAPILAAVALLSLAAGAFAESLSPERKSRLDARIKQLQSWSADPAIVAAVKAQNANPPADIKSMTNERWKQLTLLDPAVRSFSKNALGQFLRAKQTPDISECFVSAADGAKVAFLSKPSSWSHADKAKHRLPMAGKIWIGSPETDDSSGQLQVQVGLPVLDGAKPIGSIVLGLKLSAL
jgi:hypothetical protein